MAQWSTGTVTVTQGSATVTGSGTSWLSSGALAGVAVFSRSGSDAGILVASIDDDTTLQLNEPYAGGNESGVTYILNLDATTNGYQLIDETSAEWPAINNYNFELIDEHLQLLGL